MQQSTFLCACGCGGISRAGSRYVHGHNARRPFAERFFEKVSRGDGCWMWTGAVQSGGYGAIGDPNDSHKVIRAHRASWIIHCGAIPPGMDVLHRCDTPACVRPDHLFLGTAADNIADMFAKGRNPDLAGERRRTNRLTTEQVQQIRALHATGVAGYKVLGRRFGVAEPTIKGIVKRRTWQHLA